MNDREWLIDHGFLEEMFTKEVTVGAFIFEHARDNGFCSRVDAVCDNFLDTYLLTATENGDLSIDTILRLTEIDSMSAYIKENFIKLARMNRDFLEFSALSTIRNLVTGKIFREQC